ncbi:MAG: metallophosphoesterase [Prevotella sp.]|nr:metallophosphoesterase [Prevotella sp.]
MIDRIFIYLLPLIIIADTYIYNLFIKKLTQSLTLRILWFVPTILLMLGVYLFIFSDIGREHRSVFMIVYMTIAVPKIIFFVISLLDLPLRYFFKWKIYPFTILGILSGIGVVYIIIYGTTLGPTRFEIKNIDFYSSNLPDSFDGYRIVHISDLHVGKWEGDKVPLTKMVRLVNEQHADAVMITGDLVHTYAKELDEFEPLLSGIKAPDGVYSIFGNHDYGFIRWKSKESRADNLENLKQRQANMGWTLLLNDHTFLRKGNDSIALIGVENEGMPPFPQYADLPKAMRGTETSPFKILLSHDPTHWRREVLGTDIDLMLAGHTHGTQFKLGPVSFAPLLYDEWAGMYKEGKQGLYVNVGVGSVVIPFRFGAWPEITVITLKKERL